MTMIKQAAQVALVVKAHPPVQETQETPAQSLGGEDPWGRKWQPTPAFLPGEPHGRRSLVGWSPWGCKELGTTEATEYACTHDKDGYNG